MPNQLTASGLQVMTQSEWDTYFTSQFQAIYGANISLASNTPDGQMKNIFIQTILDLQDLLVSIYNSFNPDLAFGVTLDQRVSYNGIQRQAGTYSITPVTIVTSQSVNLYGLDQTAQPVYTVQDNAGTQWQLINTQLGVAAGSHIYNFQAALPGAVLTIPNTITVQATVVLGVASVNNPSTYSVLGINEESDALLKVRRQRSVALASQGFQAALVAALENISGVTSAFVYENNGATVNSDGIPGHSIWVIVGGNGAAASIAQAIYTKRNAGCGMLGAVNYTITQADGSPFIVSWDNVLTRNIFIIFNAVSINGTALPNVAAIRAGLSAVLPLGVNTAVNVNEVATLVQSIDPNTLVTGAGLTLGQTQVLSLSGVPISGSFVLNYNGGASGAINWNDPLATIQSKLAAVSGLATAVVSGSLASQTLSIDLSAAGGVNGLIYATANTLASVSGAINFSYNEGFTNTLVAPTKRNQLVASAPNIIILPIILAPQTANVQHSTSATFAAVGGYGAMKYSFQTNVSGGTINASTGVYTAGATLGTDILLATDTLGNTATAVVTVI